MWVTVAFFVATAVSGFQGSFSAPAGPGAVAPSVSAFVSPPAAPIQHVVEIWFENHAQSTVLSQGPFEKKLAQQYAFADHYYAACHPSVPDYLAATTGATWQCGTNNYATYATSNVGDLLDQKGLSWAGYFESMPAPCSLPWSGDYDPHHNPFIQIQDVVSDATRCALHDLPLTAWTTAVATGMIPNFAFIVPNILHDAHNGTVASADSWLQGFLTPLLTQAWFASTVFFVVWDESVSSDTSGYNGLHGGKVYFSAVSPYAHPGFTYTADASHYNLLTTVEWLFGLGTTGHNDNWTNFPPLKSLFSFAPNPQYVVTGSVRAAGSDLPISGANVSDGLGTWTSTAPDGGFSLYEPNGSYTLTARAPGFSPGTSFFTVSGGPATVNLTLAVREYAVSGTVASTNGTSLPGASVSAGSGVSTTSGPSGNYTLFLPNGTFNLTAAAAGYLPASGTLTIQGSNLSAVDFRLPPVSRSLSVTLIAGPLSAAAPGLVRLNATTQGGVAPFTFQWIFGDGSNSTTTLTSSAQHLFSRPGDYAVFVTVSDGAGAAGVSNLTLLIPRDQTVQAPAAAVVGHSLTFAANATVTHGTLAYSWSFGDGTRASGASVDHVYLRPGIYRVQLWVNDSLGASEQLTFWVDARILSESTGPGSSGLPGLVLGGSLAGLSGAFGFYIWRRWYPWLPSGPTRKRPPMSEPFSEPPVVHTPRPERPLGEPDPYPLEEEFRLLRSASEEALGIRAWERREG